MDWGVNQSQQAIGLALNRADDQAQVAQGLLGWADSGPAYVAGCVGKQDLALFEANQGQEESEGAIE